MSNGLWRRPNSSTPDKGSNTVIVAHRFLYTEGPNTFFHLDKVNLGEEIILFWNNTKYTYKVSQIKVVSSDEVEIEEATNQSILTLYTCTPLWTAEKRLVIVATLEKSELK